MWAYIAEHDLPYNPLHDQGYSSIGCTHCTLPGAGREGRWAGLEKTECGLHEPVAALTSGHVKTANTRWHDGAVTPPTAPPRSASRAPRSG